MTKFSFTKFLGPKPTHRGEHLNRPSFRDPLCLPGETFYQKYEPRPGKAGHFLKISGEVSIAFTYCDAKEPIRHKPQGYFHAPMHTNVVGDLRFSRSSVVMSVPISH